LTKVLSRAQLRYLRRARVGRLATVDRRNVIHIVPIVFASSGDGIYFVVDRKKKTGKRLKRVRNISETGKAALLVDHYSERWEKLSYLLIQCAAKIVSESELKEKILVAKKLKEKYPQYARGSYFPRKLDEAIFVCLVPERVIFWQNLRVASV